MDDKTLTVRYVWWYPKLITSITLLLLILVAGCLDALIEIAEYSSHHTVKFTAKEVSDLKSDSHSYEALLVLFTLLLCWVLLKWIRKRRYYWKIEPNGVLINLGYFYHDSLHFIPVENIGRVTYYRGVIGKLLNFGYVYFAHYGASSIDNSTGKDIPHKGGPFSNVIAISEAINAIRGQKGIVSQVEQTVRQNENKQISKADELEKLIALKSQGKISNQEYNELKSKLFE